MVDVIKLRPGEADGGDLDLMIGSGVQPGSVNLEYEYGPELEHLAEVLSRTSAAYRENRPTSLADAARQVSDCAAGLGLNRLSRVARTVCALSDGSDGPALAANVARLVRMGDAALGSIWQLHDASY